jgi:DNA-3-methyladenine glycosylase I
VIIGRDGKPRCAWAGAGDTAFGRYHDEVWSTRTYDESAVFEALTLGVFEVGLSWSIVFGKRDAFRKAFRGFVAKVAAMTERDVDRLVRDASIIRNRGKIQATVDNARVMMSASPSLMTLAKSYEITRERAPRSVADLPKSTPQAEAFAQQLKSQGYRFVGPTSVYAFMQHVGVVNDRVRAETADLRPLAEHDLVVGSEKTRVLSVPRELGARRAGAGNLNRAGPRDPGRGARGDRRPGRAGARRIARWFDDLTSRMPRRRRRPRCCFPGASRSSGVRHW